MELNFVMGFIVCDQNSQRVHGQKRLETLALGLGCTHYIRRKLFFMNEYNQNMTKTPKECMDLL